MSIHLDKSLIDWSLYAILDKEFIQNRSIDFLAEELVTSGAGIVQLRDKISAACYIYEDAKKVKKVTDRYGIPLIINDRVDIAMAVEADGVHLGQDDLPFATARKLIGKNKILGVSVHNLEEFNRAQKCAPDYLGVGTIYPTKTKDKLPVRGTKILNLLRAKTNLPLIAIGGLTVDNIEPVFHAGADGVAVLSGLLNAKSVSVRTKEFVQKISWIKQSLQ